ncbi:SpsE Sialic acid synthase [Candidatus Nanopelagicaceae bacterium]
MTKFIAEVSSNHNNDLDRSLRLIDAAKFAGFDAVKFQMFKIEELFSKEAFTAKPFLKDREKWELPDEFVPVLSKYAHEVGLEFSCTPFYLDAVEKLAPYCDFLKIASYELLWLELASKCAATGLPLIISTGMADLEEVDKAVNNVRTEYPAVDLVLLHAVSSYPAPVAECNLMAIQTMAKRYGLGVGWSDHTVSVGVINRAVHKFGAIAVEMHIDTDGEGFEFGSGHCWLPEESKSMIASIREGQSTDGDGVKQPVTAEIVERVWRADPIDGLRPLAETRKLL